MSALENVERSNEPGFSVETLLIDTDVHETPAGGRAMKDLIPYIDPVWQRYLKGEGGRWVGPPSPGSYVQPIGTNGVRAEWNAGGVGVNGTGAAGSVGNALDAMRHNLFEGEDVSIGILNGPNFHPSSMQSDPAFAAALASAYNDYQIEHWLDQEARLRGSVHVAAQLPELAAQEIDRIAEHPQIVQVILPLVTHLQWGDPIYQPIWEAAVRNGLVVAFHHNGATTTVLGFPRYYIEWHTFAAPQAAQNQLASLICQGTFDRNPDLMVTMLEAGVSWVQWLIWRLDQQYRELRSNVPWVEHLPSEYIRSNVRAATQPMTEVTTEQFRQLVEMTDTEGVYVFATDYPHYDADSASAVLPGTLPEDLRQRVRCRNVLETYPRFRDLLGVKHELFRLDELEPGQMRVAQADGISIVVARTSDGRVHALRNICAHMGAKLSNGYLEPTIIGPAVGEYALADGRFVIRCPWHGYEYDVESGHCLADPAHARVRAYDVTIEDGIIYVER